MIEIISQALASAEGASPIAAFEINWTLIGPIVLNTLATIGALAYTFGVVNQRIRSIDRDLERMHVDFERMREQNRDTDQRIHEMSLVLERIATKIDMALPVTVDPNTCQYCRSVIRQREEHTA